MPLFLNFSHTYGPLLLRLSHLSHPSSSHLAFFSPSFSWSQLTATPSHALPSCLCPCLPATFSAISKCQKQRESLLEICSYRFPAEQVCIFLIVLTVNAVRAEKLLKHLSHTAAHPQQSPGWLQPIWEGTEETFPRPFIKFDPRVLLKAFFLLIVLTIITLVIWKIEHKIKSNTPTKDKIFLPLAEASACIVACLRLLADDLSNNVSAHLLSEFYQLVRHN